MKVRSAEWLASGAKAAQLPDARRPEFAFLGRSNVGKSSLLNALVQRKGLARISATPGKTRLIHLFAVETDRGPLVLADLPGYGYARVPERERAAWRALVEGYLESGRNLRAAILLQDVRRDLGEDELLLVDWLAERRIPVVLAITKGDKLATMQRAKRVAAIRAQLGGRELPVCVTSARLRDGLAELWKALANRL